MKVLVASRLARTAAEEASALDAVRRCARKYGYGSAVLASEVDWARPDGEPEPFSVAVARVIPAFDVVVLIECKDDAGHPLIARGQLRCGEAALARGIRVFVYRGSEFVPVKGFAVVDPKGWREGYARVVEAT